MSSMPLGDLIVAAPLKRAGSGDYPVLSMTMHDGLVDQSRKFKKRVASENISDYKVVNHGQLVVGFPIDEGVLDIQTQYDAGIVSPAYGVWDVRDDTIIDRRYLKLFLRSARAMAYYKAKLRGSTARRRTLPSEVFLALEVPVPSRNDQRRLAAILDHADALCARRRHIVSQFDELSQAAFFHAFGDPIENSMGWPDGLLGDHAERVTDGEHKTPSRSETGVPLLSARSIQRGWIDYSATDFVPQDVYENLRHRIDPRVGDILISCSGTIGRVAQIREPVKLAMVRSVAIVRPGPALSPGFLEQLLATKPLNAVMNARANSSAQANLFQNQIRNLPIILPPLSLQKSFESQTEAVARARELAVSALSELEALLASLQIRCFSGAL